MKRAVIFLNGDRPSRDVIFATVKTTDIIICADGGAKYALECGILPSIVLGDFDSLSKVLQKKLIKLAVERHEFSPEKDFTDSELAIKYALQKGFRDIIVLGAVGDRMDHVFSNITHFSKVVSDTSALKITIIDKRQTLYFVNDTITIDDKKGKTISILSVVGDAQGVTTEGLKWKLNDEVLFFGQPRGVSNIVGSKKAEIRVKKGVLLVILQNK
jgi:thiamine pyrophosphokinase